MNLIICGDINVNYLQDLRNKSLLNSLLASFNLHSAVSFPTRISRNSSTIIDNIFIDKLKNPDYSVIPILNGLSDHDAQIIILHNTDLLIQLIQTISKRSINDTTIAQFKTNLSYESWSNVFSDGDLDSSFNNFLNTYLRIYYNSFPLEKVYLNNTKKAWLTKGIRISCLRKRELYVIYKHTTNPRIGNYYKTYSKILREVIKTAKKFYFNKLIKYSTNKPKTLWKLLTPEINKQKLTDNFPPFLRRKTG